jgi:uncharacterized protein (DUF697 family)
MLNSLKQIRAAFGLLSPDEVRKLAERPVQIGLVASSDAGYAAMENLLVPRDLPPEVRAQSLAQIHRATEARPPAHVDLVLYEPGVEPPSADDAFVFDPRNPSEAISEILYRHTDLSLPLARQFPVFRAEVVHRIIMAVARENAFFALATALPDVIPSLGELPWAVGEFATDTAFLTTNQIRMAFLIGAAYGHDVGFLEQKGTLLTIVGGAFGWRALARELAGKIPFGGGLVPKAAIAYAATFVVGKAIERLHQGGIALSPQERENIYQGAYHHGAQVAQSFRKPA